MKIQDLTSLMLLPSVQLILINFTHVWLISRIRYYELISGNGIISDIMREMQLIWRLKTYLSISDIYTKYRIYRSLINKLLTVKHF